jgi:hypothetical protein
MGEGEVASREGEGWNGRETNHRRGRGMYKRDSYRIGERIWRRKGDIEGGREGERTVDDEMKE